MSDLVGTCPKDFWLEWIAEGDAAGEPEGEGADVEVGEGETVGVGDGVGVGGGGIIFSQ